jgi:hypothetical protein
MGSSAINIEARSTETTDIVTMLSVDGLSEEANQRTQQERERARGARDVHPMSDAQKTGWRRTIERELSHNAEPCELCGEELADAVRHIEAM